MVCKNVIKGRLGGGEIVQQQLRFFVFILFSFSLYVPEIYCNVIATRFSKLSLFCFFLQYVSIFFGRNQKRPGIGLSEAETSSSRVASGSLRGCISKEMGAHRAGEGGPVDYAGLLSLRLKRTANATRLVKHSDLHPSGKIKKR